MSENESLDTENDTFEGGESREIANTTTTLATTTLLNSQQPTDDSISPISTSDGNYLGIIIGASCGVLLLILVIVAAVVVRKKRQNGGKYNPADTENRVGVGINKQMDIAAILDTPEPERLI